MNWSNQIATQLKWSGQISNLDTKRLLAERTAAMASDGDVIGIGSGSTSFLGLQALGERIHREGLRVTAIPTSLEIALTCTVMGIPTTTLLNARPNWAFDGADEVDSRKNIIKGRGGAMFQEKIMMVSSPRNVIIIDKTKWVDQLGQRFAVPIEVHPIALHHAEERLRGIGAIDVCLRLGTTKDGPVITEAGNIIVDARFAKIDDGLEKEIRSITGVVESGLFIGYDVEVLSDADPD